MTSDGDVLYDKPTNLADLSKLIEAGADNLEI